MKSFQDKINYKRLIAVEKNKQGKEKGFQWGNLYHRLLYLKQAVNEHSKILKHLNQDFRESGNV